MTDTQGATTKDGQQQQQQPEDMSKESNYITHKKKTAATTAATAPASDQREMNGKYRYIRVSNIHYLLSKCISIRINNTL